MPPGFRGSLISILPKLTPTPTLAKVEPKESRSAIDIIVTVNIFPMIVFVSLHTIHTTYFYYGAVAIIVTVELCWAVELVAVGIVRRRYKF